MDCRLDGQVALVTGGSSGIGEGVSHAMAEAGAAVVVNYHRGEEAAARIVDAIKAKGGQAIAVGADVGKPDEVDAMFARAVGAFGAVDIAVANSGIQLDAKFAAMTLEQWNGVLQTNLTGQFLTAQAAVRQFLKQGDRGVSKAIGKIIHMSSVHEVIPWSGHVNYAASKGGIGMLMRSLSQEVAEQRIRVNGIGPGAIKTRINAEQVVGEAGQNLLKLIPYGRIGVAEDVANVAVWLASDRSDYVVGTTTFVDGGMTLYPEFRDNG